MHLEEYEKVKNLTYLDYCKYLQQKYGIGLSDYLYKSWNKNPKVTRTKDGLYAHHLYEDHAIMLSNKNFAQNNPYEWQKAKNIVYCDCLEHLFLHILICKYPSKDRNPNELVGVGGVINLIGPQLNDYFSGWEPKRDWEKICYGAVKDDKDVYLRMLKQFIDLDLIKPNKCKKLLCTSFNEQFNLWTSKQDAAIFKEIKSL